MLTRSCSGTLRSISPWPGRVTQFTATGAALTVTVSLGSGLKIFTGGTGDLVFSLGTTRIIWADLNNSRLSPSQAVSGPPNATVPCGNGSAGANIGNIWGVPIGTTVTRPAVFGCNALSADDLLKFATADGADQNSYQVNVKRVSKTKWPGHDGRNTGRGGLFHRCLQSPEARTGSDGTVPPAVPVRCRAFALRE